MQWHAEEAASGRFCSWNNLQLIFPGNAKVRKNDELPNMSGSEYFLKHSLFLYTPQNIGPQYNLPTLPIGCCPCSEGLCPADELTISIFRESYPREMLEAMKNLGMEIKEQYQGIYYISGKQKSDGYYEMDSRTGDGSYENTRS